jgi:hypothetical protein
MLMINISIIYLLRGVVLQAPVGWVEAMMFFLLYSVANYTVYNENVPQKWWIKKNNKKGGVHKSGTHG